MDERAYEEWLNAPDERKVFRVWIICEGNPPYVDVPYCLSIGIAKEGFWVNEDWQYTVGSDAAMWIPPAIIRLVTKTLLDAHSAEAAPR